MSDENTENDLTGWVSTYGLITVQRLLERYQIKLTSDDMVFVLNTPDTFYHNLLRVPLRNVFNGIILQQARDYQLYAQKLFIDYLVSGESGKSEEAPGGMTREDIENQRKSLIEFNQKFNDTELEHNNLIANSQTILMQHAREWQALLVSIAGRLKKEFKLYDINKSDSSIIQALTGLLIHYDFKNSRMKEGGWAIVEKNFGSGLNETVRHQILEEISTLTAFVGQTEITLRNFSEAINDMGIKLRQFRSEFYEAILKAKELLSVLPEYRINPVQDSENKESLYFDAALGEG